MSNASSSNRCGSCGGSHRSSTALVPSSDRCAPDDADRGVFSMSPETKRALRDCAATAFCEFLRTLSEALCPDGKFDIVYLQKNKLLPAALANSVGQLACSFAHCL